MSAVLYPFLGEDIYGPFGKAIDVLAILGTLFGVAVSIGPGTQQIDAGLASLVGLPCTVGSIEIDGIGAQARAALGDQTGMI